MIYDIIILGGGPAGYNAAERAAAAHKSVLLIEKEHLGGVCLNEGCVPSKALLYSAKIADNARHGADYGVEVSGVTLKHDAVIARKNKVVATLVGGIKSAMKAHKVTVVDGDGVIQGKDADGIHVTVGSDAYVGKTLLIATGSSALVPPIPGLKESVAAGITLTNREILSLDAVPAKLGIIGGGVIGMEMASYYNSAGSDVTVIEMLPHVCGNVDIEVGNLLIKEYTAKGVKINTSSKVTKVDGGTITYEKDGQSHTLECDKILCAIGRRGNSAGIGLESLGVYCERGYIVTDRFMRTNIPDVYAAGDINGTYQLAHVAYREGEVAINNILGISDTMRYDAVPACIYTAPEIGSVGHTEATAKAAGIDVRCVKVPMMYSGRYVAEGGGSGFIKLVVDKNNVIIGVHAIGNYATEFIMEATVLVDGQYTVERARKLIFPHPTVCEMLREALFQI